MAKVPAIENQSEPPKRWPGRPKSGRRKPDASMIMSCNWEWKAALATLAKSEGLSLSDLIEVAVNERAIRQGKPPLPPRIST